jgi:hypothetical protein
MLRTVSLAQGDFGRLLLLGAEVGSWPRSALGVFDGEPGLGLVGDLRQGVGDASEVPEDGVDLGRLAVATGTAGSCRLREPDKRLDQVCCQPLQWSQAPTGGSSLARNVEVRCGLGIDGGPPMAAAALLSAAFSSAADGGHRASGVRGGVPGRPRPGPVERGHRRRRPAGRER